MSCTLSGYVYDKHCVHCMVRKIIHLRSPDAKSSRRLQNDALTDMGAEMAAKVLKSLEDKS